ncbi:MAG TPA: glucose-6-phosphate isomerase [Acidobacteriota bacterium]|jgi:glucose-6-phosphate isomerase
MNKQRLWRKFQRYLYADDELGISIDISRMDFRDDFFEKMNSAIMKAFAAMDELERGAIANRDENRMVGHYWLRNSRLAPTAAIRAQIDENLARIRKFAAQVHAGEIRTPDGQKFAHMLIIGIGGSALGPQFVSDALGSASDSMGISFFDNTDPDGMDKVLGEIGSLLPQTLTLVISKSGSTKETRNGMLEAFAAYRSRALPFERHAVAVTGEGSELDKVAQHWLARFPMWDWVGGRTSELSAVGLLPAALQGLDIIAMLRGAAMMDQATRRKDALQNPSALLALMWYHATDGAGRKDMVILPYKDRLLLFSRYLQQLVMESLGKGKDLQGKPVQQGIAVYGNKGSTDQHAYVQQLREGVPNFFVTFIEVLKDREGSSLEVEEGITSGDYLSGFLEGTGSALYEYGRQSITITLDMLDASNVGKLIALYERAVGFYATLVNINAYHQPGVEAGKKAAAAVIDIQRKAVAFLQNSVRDQTVEEIAQGIGSPDDVETVFKVMRHLAANPDRGVIRSAGAKNLQSKYRFERTRVRN